MRALTQVDSSNWMFFDYRTILREWGLPSQLMGLQVYAGIAAQETQADNERITVGELWREESVIA